MSKTREGGKKGDKPKGFDAKGPQTHCFPVSQKASFQADLGLKHIPRKRGVPDQNMPPMRQGLISWELNKGNKKKENAGFKPIKVTKPDRYGTPVKVIQSQESAGNASLPKYVNPSHIHAAHPYFSSAAGPLYAPFETAYPHENMHAPPASVNYASTRKRAANFSNLVHSNTAHFLPHGLGMLYHEGPIGSSLPNINGQVRPAAILPNQTLQYQSGRFSFPPSLSQYRQPFGPMPWQATALHISPRDLWTEPTSPTSETANPPDADIILDEFVSFDEELASSHLSAPDLTHSPGFDSDIGAEFDGELDTDTDIDSPISTSSATFTAEAEAIGLNYTPRAAEKAKEPHEEKLILRLPVPKRIAEVKNGHDDARELEDGDKELLATLKTEPPTRVLENMMQAQVSEYNNRRVCSRAKRDTGLATPTPLSCPEKQCRTIFSGPDRESHLASHIWNYHVDLRALACLIYKRSFNRSDGVRRRWRGSHRVYKRLLRFRGGGMAPHNAEQWRGLVAKSSSACAFPCRKAYTK